MRIRMITSVPYRRADKHMTCVGTPLLLWRSTHKKEELWANLEDPARSGQHAKVAEAHHHPVGRHHVVWLHSAGQAGEHVLPGREGEEQTKMESCCSDLHIAALLTPAPDPQGMLGGAGHYMGAHLE